MQKKILIFTSKTDVTADLVVTTLVQKGFVPVRFNVEDFPVNNRLTIRSSKSPRGTVHTEKFGETNLLDVKSIYYRPHEPPTPSKLIRDKESRRYIEEQSTAALNYLIDSFEGFCVSRPGNIRKATSKTLQLKLAQELGLKTPKTLITSDMSEFQEFFEDCKDEVIAKNLTNEGVVQEMEGFIYANKIDKKNTYLIDGLKYSPVMFQEYIPKKVEIRATAIGRKIFSAAIDSQSKKETLIDWRQYALKDPPLHESHQLPNDIERALKRILDYFDIEFGAFDLILTPDGEYYFLELNANGQWGWIQFMTGIPLKEEIANLLIAGHH